jgi:hypothetical protein
MCTCRNPRVVNLEKGEEEEEEIANEYENINGKFPFSSGKSFQLRAKFSKKKLQKTKDAFERDNIVIIKVKPSQRNIKILIISLHFPSSRRSPLFAF